MSTSMNARKHAWTGCLEKMRHAPRNTLIVTYLEDMIIMINVGKHAF